MSGRSARTDWVQRKQKPFAAGRVLARCGICRGEAVATGDGRPVYIRHAEDCTEPRLVEPDATT